ncbi:hypothetical protein ROZALSC1DRAFT_20439 [Rozella allomycis CSF55]|uniref:Uncharacterized protein n=1 Tax=Rozella allomycis (strain CSF55) TaxID=988480 RepID=A0A4P9YS41_ROZAC|nr:hypothetical protein ROZALSC1DRAFT_20439 [Rozella allomycis CSF55]
MHQSLFMKPLIVTMEPKYAVHSHIDYIPILVKSSILWSIFTALMSATYHALNWNFLGQLDCMMASSMSVLVMFAIMSVRFPMYDDLITTLAVYTTLLCISLYASFPQKSTILALTIIGLNLIPMAWLLISYNCFSLLLAYFRRYWYVFRT